MKRVAALDEARRLGLPTYRTGEPCRRGNVADRLVATRSCICDECAADRAERIRLSYQRRKAVVSVRNSEHYKKNRDYYVEYQKRYRLANGEALAKNARRHHETHKELRSERDRLWRLANPEKAVARRKRYYQENKSLFAAQVNARKAAKSFRVPNWFSEFDQMVCEESADLVFLRKACTGVNWDVDHMLPLRGKTVSGLHCGLNLQVIPTKLNRSKGNSLRLTVRGEWVRHL